MLVTSNPLFRCSNWSWWVSVRTVPSEIQVEYRWFSRSCASRVDTLFSCHIRHSIIDSASHWIRRHLTTHRFLDDFNLIDLEVAWMNWHRSTCFILHLLDQTLVVAIGATFLAVFLWIVHIEHMLYHLRQITVEHRRSLDLVSLSHADKSHPWRNWFNRVGWIFRRIDSIHHEQHRTERLIAPNSDHHPDPLEPFSFQFAELDWPVKIHRSVSFISFYLDIFPSFQIHSSSNGSMPHHTEYRYADPKVTVYSITTVPTSKKETDENSTRSKILVADRLSLSPESELIRGGLTGLQNLGNTVRSINRQWLSQTDEFLLFLVLYEFSSSMLVEYKTIVVVCFTQWFREWFEYIEYERDERSADARWVLLQNDSFHSDIFLKNTRNWFVGCGQRVKVDQW